MKRRASLVMVIISFTIMLFYALPVLADEFDDGVVMRVGEKYQVNQSSDGEKSYFRFVAPEDGIYILTDNGECAGQMYIYNDDKEIIRSYSQSYDSNRFEIIYKMSKGADYYFTAESKYSSFEISISKMDESSVEWIALDESYMFSPDTMIGEASSGLKYFCVPEDGYYCFYANGEGDCCGKAEIHSINAIYSNFDTDGYGYNYYGYYPLKKDCVYPVTITCGMMGSQNTGVYYNVSSSIMDIRANYSIGDTLNRSTTASHTFYSIIPEKTSEIVIENKNSSYSYYYLYDTISNQLIYSSYTHKSLTYNVVAGQQYYLIIEIGNYSLKSAYIDSPDNTTVTTSTLEDMQSKHYYENNLNKTWTYTAPQGTLYMDIEFNADTNLLDDKLYIYNSDGTLHSQYKSNELAGKTITLLSDTFSLKFVTNQEYVGYGFKIDSITNYNNVVAPVPDIVSGTIRPSDITLTAHDAANIYYKLKDDAEFNLYSEPISIVRSCTLYAYAQIGDTTSPVVTYEYVIDNSLLSPPEIKVESENGNCITLSLSAPEGTIYYKRLLTDYDYKEYSSGKIYLNQTDMLVAYASVGLQKSEYVYYGCELEQSGTFELSTPTITVENIEGGKRITIRTSESLGSTYTENNYCGEHRDIYCGKYGYNHTLEQWSIDSINSYMDIWAGGETNTTTEYMYYKNLYTFDVYENTYVSAQNLRDISGSSGFWFDYDNGYYVEHRTQLPDMDTTVYYDDSVYSKKNCLFVEVPKASAPKLSISDGKTVITSDEGTDIYYSINGGGYTKYTTPITLSESDKLVTYAIGSGSAKSEETSSMTADIDTALSIVGKEVTFDIRLTNNLVEKDVLVIAAAYDEETSALIDAKTAPVTAKNGTNYINEVTLGTNNSKKVRIKLFVWNDSLASLSEVKSYTVE